MTKIWAHRGASALYPENTLLAFQKAVELGVDGIELDVHLTRDGVPVVAHDERIDRVANGSGLIAAMTYGELARLNFGVAFPALPPQPIPTLDQVLALLSPGATLLNIELKTDQMDYPGLEGKTLKALEHFGMVSRTVLSSFNPATLRRLQRLAPQLQTALLYKRPLRRPWVMAQQLGAAALHPYYRFLFIPGLVRRCRQHGIALRPWTVNEPRALRRLLSMGVEGIITDRPDRALRLAKFPKA